MITIKSLGGSGQDSRNCFLISFEKGSILLDCGVRREIADKEIVYPLLDKETVADIKAVFLSHCHEDHSAALPYLYHLGYDGVVYASKQTIELTPSFLYKWQDYVLNNNGQLPFDKKDTEKIVFKQIDEQTPYLKEYGKSGHVLGGLWYLFEIEDKTILYTGDFTFDSLTLKTDSLPQADYLIIDSAYASRILDQHKQYNNILESIKDTLSINGTVLLPVPSNGRGIDLYLYLKKHNIPIVLEQAVQKSTDNLLSYKDWIKDLNIEDNDDNTIIINDINRNDISLEAKVIITPDGMMTSDKAIYYFNKIKHDYRNKVIITGHSAKDTLARNIQDDRYRIDNNIELNVEVNTIKVHLDFNDVLNVIRNVRPKAVMLFHSAKKDCQQLKEEIESMSITVVNEVNKQLY